MNTTLLRELVTFVDSRYTPQDISLHDWVSIRRIRDWYPGGGITYEQRLCPAAIATRLPRCQLGKKENLSLENGCLSHVFANTKQQGDSASGFYALAEVFKCEMSVVLALFDTPSKAELETGENQKYLWLARAEKLLDKPKTGWIFKGYTV